jgi:quercetin dioxygenase-like cupin family protein
MDNLVNLAEIAPIRVWDNVTARRVQGDRITMAVVELDPDAIVPEHRHANEQNGMVLQGEVRFRIGNEERVLGPGGTWRIRSDVPHAVLAGSDGAVVIDVFTPIRADWDQLDLLEPTRPVWPPTHLKALVETGTDELVASPRSRSRGPRWAR